ncbi:MAG: thiamine biosynthesis lipoprotein [Alphaproteobacteria bacterium]|jgi:thiamine biosynthesis lipoprotein
MVTLQGKTMGTTYSVKYVNAGGAASKLSPTKMQAKIDDLLVEINQLMSTYMPDSELSLLNKAQANVAFPISPATEYVIQEALKLNNKSQGMLDITVGPLVNLWGFGPTLRANKIPTEAQLAAIMDYIGVDKFTLSNGELIKSHPKVYIDLSTIAKGYAVDEVAALLLTEGLTNYLVEIGGEMRVAGTKLNNEQWLIAIEKPLSSERAIQRIVSIGDNAMATSGDYRNYFEEDGIRYSHLINPTTGYPIQHNLVAVTVVAPKSIEADGLATALMVMGSEQSKLLAENEGIAAFFITKEGDEYVEYQSTEFTRQVQIIEQKKVN